MNIRIKNIFVALTLLVGLSLSAATVDDGKRLYLEGDYNGAIELLRPIVRRSPRNGNANYWLGASLMALGDKEAAREHLLKAAERGVTNAYSILTIDAMDSYDVDAAGEYIDDWRERLRRNRKPIPESIDSLGSRLIKMRNMLARVEKIQILDSIVVPKRDFISAYRLSTEAGRLLPAESVGRIINDHNPAELSIAFMPENESELLWAAADSASHYRLYNAGILDDGTPDYVSAIDSTLSSGGNAQFPFLMPDGTTLYFAADGENSLGGYDIFMTIRSTGEDGTTEYYAPQNIGMPYNSPYDDYMLAIDENSGLGWWATDRNQIPDSITVFVFIPEDVRTNIQTDDPNLSALARLSNISLTHLPDVDYSTLLASKLPQQAAIDTDSPTVFELDLGNGQIYTSLSDFRKPEARAAMIEYLGAVVQLRRHLEAEERLRAAYAAGDTSKSTDILYSEEETAALRHSLRTLRNNAIRLENR